METIVKNATSNIQFSEVDVYAANDQDITSLAITSDGKYYLYCIFENNNINVATGT